MPLDTTRNSFGDDAIRGLSAEEVNVLRRLLHRMQQQVPSNPSTGNVQPTQQYTPYNLPSAPTGCYMIQAPSGGIPYATLSGTGTLYGTGTLTSYPDSFTPGAAECQVFYHVPDPELVSEGPYEIADDSIVRVYNYATTSIPEGTFVPVIKDADGNWITVSPVLGEDIALPVNQIGYGTGFSITSEPGFTHSQSGEQRIITVGYSSGAVGMASELRTYSFLTSAFGVFHFSHSSGLGGLRYVASSSSPTIIELITVQHNSAGGAPNTFYLFSLVWEATALNPPSEDGFPYYNLSDDKVKWGTFAPPLFIDTDVLKIFTSVPATASSTGVAGEMAFDGSFLYVCTAANTWKRVPIATW